MYSEEDKRFYLRKMRSEGLCPTEAARLWGVPSRLTLAKWLREEREGKLEVGEVKVPHACPHKKHQLYPEETKREALRLVSLGKPRRDVARMLGLRSAQTVANFERQARERGTIVAEATGMTEGGGAAAGDGELERLRLENATLREMLSDPKAGDPERLSNRRKAELGERLRRDYGFPLRRILTFLRISKSSYEYERRALARPRPADAGFDARVAAAFRLLHGTCGYRRVRAAMLRGAAGVEAGPAPERRVRDSMRRQGLHARRGRRRRPYSSYEGEFGDRPANVPRERAAARRASGEDFRLAHDFSARRPGELLVTDVTEFALNGFGAYASPVVDCWDGCPVGWASSPHPDGKLCTDSLAGALGLEPEGEAPVVHTDGGACYWSHAWLARCAAAGATRSMSRKGNCGDNARAEGFFGNLKQEFFYGRDWSGVTLGGFLHALDEYVDWYVYDRPKAFGEDGGTVYETPAEHRRRHGAPVPPRRCAGC